MFCGGFETLILILSNLRYIFMKWWFYSHILLVFSSCLIATICSRPWGMFTGKHHSTSSSIPFHNTFNIGWKWCLLANENAFNFELTNQNSCEHLGTSYSTPQLHPFGVVFTHEHPLHIDIYAHKHTHTPWPYIIVLTALYHCAHVYSHNPVWCLLYWIYLYL